MYATYLLVATTLTTHLSSCFPSVGAGSKTPVCQLYTSGEIQCCLCGPGQKLKQACSVNPEDTVCEPCAQGTYNSHPTSLQSCEPCTSCSHPNANLEEEEPCSSTSDTKCKCKQDHYCSSATEEICKLCYPCKDCGPEGIKVHCTATNDTVCKDKHEDDNHALQTSVTVGGIVLVLVIILTISWIIWKKQKVKNGKERKSGGKEENGNANDMVMQPLSDVDLMPHRNRIAMLLGWKTMKTVARSTRGFNPTHIESCQTNHQGDSQEQTLELLEVWVESQGMNAASKLIEILENNDKKKKAQEVMEILSNN